MPTLEVAPPLDATEAATLVRVQVNLLAQPTRTKQSDASSTVLSTDGYAATADPTNPAGGPRCSG